MRQSSRPSPSTGKVIPFPGRLASPPRRRAPVRRVRVGRLLLVVFASYLLVAAGFEVAQLVALRRELHRTRQQIALQEAVNAGLRDQIAYTRTDEYLKKAALQLGLVRPGEILFLFPESFATPDYRD